MQWTPTDQFGNLYEGISDAESLEALRPCLDSMIDELQERASGPIRMTVDIDYREINGPDPENVSHILRVAWFEGQDKSQIHAGVSAMVEEICTEKGIEGVTVGMG
ncbi:MAG: hypothetical protein KF784_10925 [Fimbriimonadaceae bacterium]|nr:hypothetical protein [Fimbriimonadaceae bacterium]